MSGSIKLNILHFIALLGTVLTKTEEIRLITRNTGYYDTQFTWTIEDFKDLPYVEVTEGDNGPFFHSPLFPAKSKDVKWSVGLDYNITREERSTLDLFVHLDAPESISSFTGSCECRIMDIEDKARNVQKVTREINNDSPFEFISFLSREELENEILIPDGDLTIQCRVKGHLKTNLSSLDDIIPTQELTGQTCRDKMFKETAAKLQIFNVSNDIHQDHNYITVSSSGTKFLFQRNLLVLRAPHANDYVGKSNIWDVTEHVNPTELEVFLTFTLKGDSPHLKENCPNLYKFAVYLGYDCLRITCEELSRIKSQIKSNCV